MEISKTSINGVFLIKIFSSQDNRGVFCKTFCKDFFDKNNFCVSFEESFYTSSSCDVIRGMHFQIPPFDLEKLIYVVNGKILDVVLDMRKDSPTYKKHESFEISGDNKYSILIPKGVAHGFKSLEDNTITVYNVSKGYNSSCDTGVRWDSFGFDWAIDNPIISERDKNLKTLEEFQSPF